MLGHNFWTYRKLTIYFSLGAASLLQMKYGKHLLTKHRIIKVVTFDKLPSPDNKYRQKYILLLEWLLNQASLQGYRIYTKQFSIR